MSTTNGHAPALPGISPDVAHERGYVRIQSERQLSAYTQSLTLKQQQIPGLLIPVYQLGNPTPYEHVLRPDKPRIDDYTGKPIKYEWPARVPLVLDVLPCYREALHDPTIPIWITEGAKKADALASAFGPAIVPMNINGVWAWKHPHKDGSSHELPDFDQVAWNGREVVLAFDNDVVRNPKVQKALRALRGFLKTRDAAVRVLVLPDNGDKVGVDDALAGGMTADDLRSLVRDDLPQPAGEPRTPKLLHADQLDTLPKSPDLIPGFLSLNTLHQVFGRAGAGKSFLNLDIALSVAQYANVVYLAAEDAERYPERIKAWKEHHQASTGDLFFWPEPVNLLNPEAVSTFLAEVHPLQPALIIIDTLQSCMVGADENSTRDMGLAIEALNTIRRQTTAAILVCHHTGWSDQHERGNSALRAACRLVMKLSQSDDGLITLSCEKTNSAKFEPRYFRLLPIGDSRTVIPASKLMTRDTALTEKHFDLLEALSMAIFAGGATHSQLVEHLDMPKSTVNKGISKLLGLGYVEASDGRYKQYTLTATGKHELQNHFFFTANSPQVHSEFTAPSELALNWAIAAPQKTGGEFTESSLETPHSNAVVHSVHSEFTDSSLEPELFTSPSPPYKGDGVNSEHGEQEKTEPESKPVSGIDHDKRRIVEARDALETGDIKAARAAANLIRGRKEQKAADQRIDEYVAAHKPEVTS